MKTFETGKKYFCVSICDSNCEFEYEILKRTSKSVTIYDDLMRKKVARKIHIIDDTEVIYPEGRYSMCPVLRATGVR